MMVKIVTDINVLRRPCILATRQDDVTQLAGVMLDVMAECHGQGLAANQVGANIRVIVMQVAGRSPVCIVNPVIGKTKGWQKANEGCLSLPGRLVMVKRPAMVRVTGCNQYWQPVRYRFQGIEARRACHEIDHLNGRLIIDYAEQSKDA